MKETDLLTIKNFSDLTGVKQSTLRYYDDVKLFSPIERGENGYRYYSATQTIAINLINVLSGLNIPLKQICRVQRKRTPELMLELLHRQEQELNRELLRLQQAYSIIHTYCEIIREGLAADENAVAVRRMNAATVELGPLNDFSSGYFYESFFIFMKQMEVRNIDAAYPAGGFYNDMDEFSAAPGQPSRYFCIAPTGRDMKEAGEYLVGYARGYYGGIGDLPQRMRAYAEEHGLVFFGPVYEAYLHDEISIAEPDRYLIQASVRVKKRRSRAETPLY